MVGPVPPPYTGQSVSFEKLKLSLQSDLTVSEVLHVNTAPKKAHITGSLSIFRLLETVHVILHFAFLCCWERPSVIYLTKGSTKNGFMRDFFLLVVKNFFIPKSSFIVHLKGGNYDSFYNSCSLREKSRVKWFLKNVSNIVVLGKSLVKMYDFFPEARDKIVVIENALTFGCNFNESSSRKAFGRKIKILFLSNLIYTKGYGHLLEACELLVKKGVEDFHITFAGAFMESPDDPLDVDIYKYQKDFLKSLQSNNLASFVDYVGVVNGNAKVELLEKSDVFVLPTQYHVEGQPVSIIEAMAYGCAIVTTNYRSIPDLIEDEGNSVYVNYADPQSIADALERFITDRSFLQSCSIRSAQIYQEKFRWDVHYNKMKTIFGIS